MIFYSALMQFALVYKQVHDPRNTMTRTRAILRAIFGIHSTAPAVRRRCAANRVVMMRVTLDAQHVTPLRRALTRDCAGQPWTIRIATLPGTGRVQLSLYLPRDAVNGAIEQVTRVAPAAEFGHLFEIPDTPTDAWRDLLRSSSWARAATTRISQRAQPQPAHDTLDQLIRSEQVLLDLPVANRDALFVHIGKLCETRYGTNAAKVTAGLAAREELGSTGLGQGVAVPHTQIAGLHRAVAIYVRPLKPVAFFAPDLKPVSDVIALLVPEGANTTHLNLLADVAQRFCDQHFREQLHACTDPRQVCDLFAGYGVQDTATSVVQMTHAAVGARAAPHSRRIG
jgi:PTS system nitrogen regulatory IIA component